MGKTRPIRGVVGARTSLDMKASDFPPGSQIVSCACGHPAWFSPSGQALLERRRVRAICSACFLEDPSEVEMAPGAIEELRAMGYTEESVRQVVATVNYNISQTCYEGILTYE